MEEINMEQKKMIPTISEPDVIYKESYLKALKEYHQEGRYLEYDEKKLESNFSDFVKKLKENSIGLNLKPGYVPQTVYWVVDQEGFAGRVLLRHELNEHLLKIGGHIGDDIRPSKRGRGYGTEALKLVLPKARAMGLKKVLLTCDSTNIGSRKIIKANGGILENEVLGENGEPSKLRFWIEL
jgi:predicted acetyltransferase